MVDVNKNTKLKRKRLTNYTIKKLLMTKEFLMLYWEKQVIKL